MSPRLTSTGDRVVWKGAFLVIRIGINGFGRIGRQVLRQAVGREGFQIVAVNSRAGAEAYLHLVKRDSTYGAFPEPVSLTGEGMKVGEGEVVFTQEPEPRAVPWSDLGVDVVVEASGIFRDEAARGHIESGASRVVITGPSTAADLTVVLGINEDLYDPGSHQVISNASCTTNCLAPVAKVLHETFGVRSGLMNTVHSYTTDQRLLDGSHRDPRRARAAATNIVPTTTGAAVAVGEVLPELRGRLDGFAVRVPTPTVSLLDLVVNLAEDVTEERVEEAMRQAAAGGRLRGILGVSDEPVVSSDFKGSQYSAVVDLPLTTVMAGSTVRVVAWYDNELAYATRVVDLVEYIIGRGL